MAIEYFITAMADDSEYDCFTIMQTSEERARERAAQWQLDIDTGAWQQWTSEKKRVAVGEALARDSKIRVYVGVTV